MSASGTTGSSGLLEKKQKAADTDAALARSIENAKNVTLGYFFHISAKEVGHLTEQQIAAGEDQIANARFQMVRAQKGADESVLIRAYAAQPNLPILSEAGENSGYFNTFPDSDGVIRWSPLVIKFRDNYYSSLALSMLVQYQDWPMLSLGLAEYGVESVRLDKLRIPTDESGRMLMNYLGPAKTFPHYSDLRYPQRARARATSSRERSSSSAPRRRASTTCGSPLSASVYPGC